MSGCLRFRFGTARVELEREPRPVAETQKLRPGVRLSKIEYYLVDNLQVIRLSQVEA